MFKERNVVMLPTSKKALNGFDSYTGDMYIYQNKLWNSYNPNCNLSITNVQYLYITSNEEFEVGIDSTEFLKEQHISKIIASNDTNLNLPKPSSQFIQKFIEEHNKGNVITKVMVEYEEKEDIIMGVNCANINDLQLKLDPKNNTINIQLIPTIYSREEMCLNMQYYYEYIHMNDYVTPQYWLDNLKHF
jgi:hypothetical protein